MSSSLTYFSGRAARRLRKRVAAVLMSTALAAASAAWAADKPGDIEADALRSVLTAEIALQRGLYPQAWRQFMNAAQSLKNAELAGRAYDAASAAGNTENAQIALELWQTLDPKNSRVVVLTASKDLASTEPNVRAAAEKRLTAELKKTKQPTMMLARIYDAAGPEADRQTLYTTLERLAANVKKNARIELLLAAAADAAGYKRRAAQHAVKASDYAPDDSQILMSGADFEYRINPSATTRRLTEFLKRHPDDITVRTALAKSLIRTGTVEDVKRELDIINRKDGTSPQTMFALGMIAEEAGLFTDAELYYNKYLVAVAKAENGERYLPDAAYARLAMVKLQQGDKMKAVEWFAKVEKGDKYLPSKMKQAEILADMNRTDEACRVLREIRADNGKKAQFRLACSDLYMKVGRTKDAYQAADEALKTAPHEPNVIYRTAMLAEAAGEGARAEALLTHYIEIAPGDANGYNALGYMWLERGVKTKDAAPLIEKAMELSKGKDSYIVDSMGWLRYRQGKLKEAEQYLRQALSMNPDVGVALHLAEVLARLGNHTEAVKYLEAVLKASPQNVTAQRLMQTLKATGERQ